MRVVFAREAGIALLRFAEETFFRRQQCAAAVHVNAAAFKYDSTAFVDRLEQAAFEYLAGASVDLGVLPVIGVFGPAVENEMIERNFACGIRDADGTRVAHPAAVGGDLQEAYGLEIGAGLLKNGANALLRGGVFDEEI